MKVYEIIPIVIEYSKNNYYPNNNDYSDEEYGYIVKMIDKCKQIYRDERHNGFDYANKKASEEIVKQVLIDNHTIEILSLNERISKLEEENRLLKQQISEISIQIAQGFNDLYDDYEVEQLNNFV